MVTNGKQSRDTGNGEVDGLRSTVAYLATPSTAFPYGDSKACSLFGILLSPMSGVEWADLKVSVSEAFPECALRVDSRKSEIPMLWNKLRDHWTTSGLPVSESWRTAGGLKPKRLTGRCGRDG